MRENTLRKIWARGEAVVNGWLSIPSSFSAEVMAQQGFDWLCVDMQHGIIDYQVAVTMLQAISTTDTVPIVRVPWNDPWQIMKALDAGAYGVIVPLINTAADAEAAVAACLYPPAGNRSVGGSVHALNFQATANDYYARANEEILVVLQCEHIRAVQDADAIFSVPGIDAIFVGPNDLAASMRSPDGRPPSGDATREAMQHILQTCRKHHVAPGLHCTSAEEVLARMEEGWQFIAIGSELKMLLDGAASIVRRLGADKGKGDMAKY